MSVKDIADTINVHYSTVYRELKRNKGRYHYHWSVAQKQCDERKRRMRRHRKFSLEMRKEIIALMVNEQWSPEQVRGWMLRKGKECVCVETIYSYIRFDRRCGGELYKSCRHRMQHIRRRHSIAYTAIRDRTMIDEREPQADGTRFGDWEMDTIIGKDGRGAILTLVGRSKDCLLMRKLPRGKNAEALAKTVVAMMTPFIGNKASPLTTEASLHATRSSHNGSRPKFTSHTPIHHGRRETSRTQTNSSDNISLKEQILNSIANCK